MKLECEVIGAETQGDFLEVKFQGNQERDADWRRMGVQSIQIAYSPVSARTFYVGRRVMITVDAK